MDAIGFTIDVRVAVQLVDGVPVIGAIDIVAIEPVQTALADVALAGERPWVH